MQCTTCGFPRGPDGGPCLVCSGQWSLPESPPCPGCGALTAWSDLECASCRRELVDLDPDAVEDPSPAGMWDEASVRKAWAKMERERRRELRDWSRFRHVAAAAAVALLLGLLSPLAVVLFAAGPADHPADIYHAQSGIAAPPADAPRATQPAAALAGGLATIDVHYSWEYGGKRWTWDFSVDEALVEYFRARDRSSYDREYAVFVTDPADDAFLHQVADRLAASAAKEGYSDLETLSFLLSFIQSLPYATDASVGYDEYPRYPLETLVDAGSDCEDTSILFASLAQLLGYNVVLLSPPGHMGVGVTHGSGAHVVHEGTTYVYAETTGTGWRIGQLPPEYDGQMRVYTLEPQAVLGVPVWSAPWQDGAYAVAVTVRNVGAAAAQDIVVYAAFDAGDGLVWDQGTCGPALLAAGSMMTCTIRLKAPPQGTTSHLLVQAWAANAATKSSVSQDFEA